MNTRPDTDDATLVAWIDGELTQPEADAIAAKVAQDMELADRAELLRAARAELRWAIEESPTAPPPIAERVRARRSPRALGWLVAAAALVVVIVLADQRGATRDTAAENDLLSVELSMPRAGWDLFTDVRFTLRGRAKTDRECRVFAAPARPANKLGKPWRTVEGDIGEKIEVDGTSIPLAVLWSLEAPDGRYVGTVAGSTATFTRESGELKFSLTDLRTSYPGIAPYLTVAIEDDGASEDFRYGLQHGIAPTTDGGQGFVPLEPGNYRLTLHLRALRGADGKHSFDEPLEVSIGFAIRGVVGEWSEPVDGVRARIVASRAEQTDGRPLAIAVQLRNDSDRARRYNVVGTTIAKIPQPFHFDLLHDGRQGTQRDDLGVVMLSAWGGALHEPGTVRSVIVLDDYWRVDGEPPSMLRGEHELAIRFDFKPSLWQNGDRELWMGTIDTPPIRITNR